MKQSESRGEAPHLVLAGSACLLSGFLCSKLEETGEDSSVRFASPVSEVASTTSDCGTWLNTWGVHTPQILPFHHLHTLHLKLKVPLRFGYCLVFVKFWETLRKVLNVESSEIHIKACFRHPDASRNWAFDPRRGFQA